MSADHGMIVVGAGAGAGGARRGERGTDRAAERHGPRQVRARHRAAAPGQVRHPRHPLLRGKQSSSGVSALGHPGQLLKYYSTF